MCQRDENNVFCALCEKEFNKIEMFKFRSAPDSEVQDGWSCTKCLRDGNRGKREVAKPQDGGCWYCNRKDSSLVFDIEFDTFVHKSCTAEALRKDPEDTETRTIARSIGILEEDKHE